MALILRHALDVLASRRARSHFVRLTTALLLALGLIVAASACGMNAQTLKPYTPAEGVNASVGSVQIRNLMILSRAEGDGFLSASLVSGDRDALVGVSGSAIKVDGATGAAFKATLSNPVAIGNNDLVVLTNRPPILIKSADLVPGLTANLTLQFSTAGELTLVVPVVDADQKEYATITPSPVPSPAS